MPQPANQPEEFLDDQGNPVTLDDSGNVVNSQSSQQTQALDDSGSLLSSISEFGGGVKDIGMGILSAFNPIGEVDENDPLSKMLGFSLQTPSRRMAEGMISSARGAVTDVQEGDPLRAAAGVVDIAGLPATGVLDLSREGNYSRAAGQGAAGGLLAMLGAKSARVPKASGALIPEVLPPIKPRIAGLLEAPVDPIIVGVEGRAQKRSLLNPQEEARLAGYDISAETGPVGKPTSEIPPGVNLGELRELERQRNLRYTEFEHQGGVPLTIEQDLMPSPSRMGETRLGFESLVPDSGDLQYPLNVVPQAVQPRSSQTVTSGLVPDRFAEPLTESRTIRFGNEQIDKPIPERAGRNLMGGTAAIEPGETLLPSAIRSTKKQVRENTGLNAPVGNIKVPPEVPKAVAEPVKAGVAKFVQESKNPSNLMKSVYTQLGELGKSGKELVQRFQRAAQHRAEYDAVWTEPLFKIGGHLKKAEHDNFGQYVEGKLPIPNERVQAAVDSWNTYQNQMGDMAVNKQLHLKRGNEVIPFEKIEKNYWPHIPTENLTKATIVDRLMKGGMTRHEASIVAKRWENTGEIFLRGQHSRLRDQFDYRQSFDVAIHHGRSMSKRIANHENLGPKDIAGKGDEGIANLIEDTTDVDLAYKLAKRLAGREALPNERLIKGLNQARKWMSLTSLPNFTIPNVILGQATNSLMAVLSKHPISAAMEVTKLIRGSYRDQIRASGVYNSFNRTMLEELSGIDPFQIGAGERINRSIAAAIGKSTVREAFKDYKAGTNVRSARYFLETLLARDPDSITAITPELERFAAGRMAEITQGLNNPGNLPYGWSNPINTYGSVATQLALIFKKVGFQTTKTVKDSIKASPVLGPVAWATIAQIAGEMVGDVKSVITGKERPEDLSRIADNWGNAFMLGLPWELATSAQYGPTAPIAAAAGPVAGKASELMYSGYATGRNLMNDSDDPTAPLRRFGLKNLPIPGRERIRTMVEED